MKKKTNFTKLLSLCLCIVLIAAMALITCGCEDKQYQTIVNHPPHFRSVDIAEQFPEIPLKVIEGGSLDGRDLKGNCNGSKVGIKPKNQEMCKRDRQHQENKPGFSPMGFGMYVF